MLNSDAQNSALEAWMDAIPEIAPQRDLILTERTEIKEERKLLYQQEEYFVKVVDHLFSLMESTNPDDPSSKHQEEIIDLLTKTKTSRQDLGLLRQRTSMLEDRLSSHEYMLTKTERKAYDKVDSYQQQGLLQQTLRPSPLSDHIERPSQPPDSSPQDLREELYSRMADVRILLDRLHDFEDYLRGELDDRDILRASGQTPLSNDADFFDEARIERATLQTEFEEAQADVDRLKQLCVQQGVGFQDVHFEDPFQRETCYDDTYSTLSTQEEAATLPLPESPPGILGTFFATRERVKNWLKDPSSSDTLVISGAERRSEERKRQNSRSDTGWVVPHSRGSWPGRERPPSSTSSAGDEAQYGIPIQISGSEGLEALLKASMDESIKPYAKTND